MTSPTLGTGGKRLWLLRSRPDQVDRPSMRGGPSRRILSPVAARRDSLMAKTRLAAHLALDDSIAIYGLSRAFGPDNPTARTTTIASGNA